MPIPGTLKSNFSEAATKILLGVMAASAVSTGVGKLYDFVKLHNDQDNSYKDMFKKVPQLKEYDKAKVDDYYQVVKSFAPHMATNPYVVGNIVNKMILNDGVDHRLVGDIADISNNIAKPKRDVTEAILQTTLKPFIPDSKTFYGHALGVTDGVDTVEDHDSDPIFGALRGH